MQYESIRLGLWCLFKNEWEKTVAFDLIKFRTMVVDAESKLEDLLHGDEKIREEYRKHHKLRNDPRLTSVR